MSKLIALDDGHGMDTPGKRSPYIDSLGRSIKENEFNREVVKFLDQELKQCGFDTLLVAPTDQDTPLTVRTNQANQSNADAYIAIHYNAFDGSFGSSSPSGISLHVYNGHRNQEAGKLAESIAKYLKLGTKQNYRGIIENNFHVLRETTMIAVLSENGFMDNEREALLMLNSDFQREVASEHAQGICEYFGVEYVNGSAPSPPPQNEAIEDSTVVEEPTSLTGARVESIYRGSDRLNFRSKATWSDQDIVGTFGYGEGWIIRRLLKVEGSYQYEVKNSKGAVYYITASQRYVKVIGNNIPSSADAIVPYPGKALQLGSSGKDVQRVQRAVQVTVDGSYGPITRDAVRAYQSRHGLQIDGIVGPNTWNVLF
ncbi:N-acetylmuramoyl-L-alanine amidase [Halobacillus seohaensis]|uniref:N-acetylmuramoyl-L-alanine amidase n=1 Tax=Halobacillus seohaensis TaxID=447421 RepID=A0ABW2EQ05_9BACI